MLLLLLLSHFNLSSWDIWYRWHFHLHLHLLIFSEHIKLSLERLGIKNFSKNLPLFFEYLFLFFDAFIYLLEILGAYLSPKLLKDLITLFQSVENLNVEVGLLDGLRHLDKHYFGAVAFF